MSLADRRRTVAVIGATGAVGAVFLQVLQERRFPFGELRLLASHRSAGKTLKVGSEEMPVRESSREALEGADLVFISASDEASRRWAPAAVELGATVIDDSGVWRMEPTVPLVVPEVNAEDIVDHQGILAIPNCTTTPLVMVLDALRRVNPLRRVIADTYQAVSGTGAAAVRGLEEESRAALTRQEPRSRAYPHPIAFNLIPQIGGFKESGYTSEEWKMEHESRKILHDPDLPLSATCVRVPVMVGHSTAVHVELEHPMTAHEARQVLGAYPGLVVQDDPAQRLYPQPLTAAGRDEVFVGRLRQDSSCPKGLALWLSCDNLRKGAATNALQIAEELLRRGLL